MTAKEDMPGRLFGLAVGILMLAEAYALWRPQALGALPQPDLGPFSQYRLVIALLSAGAGVVVMLAALMRDTSKEASPAERRGSDRRTFERRSTGPLTLELGAPQPAGPAPSELEHAPLAPPPVLDVVPPPAPVAEDPDRLDPFPGTEPASPLPLPIADAAPAAMEPSMPLPATAPGDDRGRFLELSDEGHHFRSAGRLDEAHERYDDALALARRRAAAHPGNAMARRDLAAALTNLGDMHDREGHLDQAISLHEESLGVRQGLTDEAPNDLAALRSLSPGLERLAEARDARGHRSRARDLFRLRAGLDQRLMAMAPGDAEISAAAAVTHERLRELDQALAV